ncbi:zinc-ribbon domain-containing protein [soil metagenome]
MIIFGTRGITTNPDKGTFFCPSCGPETPFRWRRVRRFFTLYFIPVIPMNMLGEYIECQRCKGTYDIQVLQFDPAKAADEMEAQYQVGMRQVMITMLLADGEIDEGEIDAIRRIYRELCGKDLDEATLRQQIDELHAQGISVQQILGGFSGMLNPHGQEKVLEAAYLVAMADGDFHESEQALLVQIGETLGLSKAHFRGLMDSLTSGERVTAPVSSSNPPPLPGA